MFGAAVVEGPDYGWGGYAEGEEEAGAKPVYGGG